MAFFRPRHQRQIRAEILNDALQVVPSSATDFAVFTVFLLSASTVLAQGPGRGLGCARAETTLLAWNDLLDGLKQRETSVESLAAAIDYVRQSWLGNQRESRFTLLAIIKTDKCLWWDCEGAKHLDPDGSVRQHPCHKQMAYDGQFAKELEYDPDGEPSYATIHERPYWFGVNRFQILSQSPDATSYSEFLQARGGASVDYIEEDGHEVAVVETEPTTADNETWWKYRLHISPQRGFAVTGVMQLRQAAGEDDWRRNDGRFFDDFKEVERVWLPHRLVRQIGGFDDVAPVMKAEGNVRQWQVNPEVPDRRFRLKFPPGICVSDKRSDPPRT